MQRIQNMRLRLSVLACLTAAGLAFNSAATAACVDPNTCYGTDALASVTTGSENSAFGYEALFSTTEGVGNTASGYLTLYFNTEGSENTASGYFALPYNTTGNRNTATGGGSLYYNTTGNSNTANGFVALFSNDTGSHNTASGNAALYTSTGSYNTAVGDSALTHATGSRNVALGYNAGYAIKDGKDNIVIGTGQKGGANDSGVIRIGNSSFQTKAFMAGIRGVTTNKANAVPVLIDSNGQLGTISSSARFKEDIQPMGSVSERLFALRPVTFRYKQPYEDGSKPVQFGLVAEEVAEQFPELVVYGEDGKAETVSYHLLATLLLNELQKQHRAGEDQLARIAVLEQQATELAQLRAQVTELGQLRAQVATLAKTIERLNDAQLLASR